MALFNRQPKPEKWVELWQVLTPLAGRTTPQDLARLRESLKTQPTKTVRKAQKQLATAMGHLDTEDHARYLRRDPWRGPDQPFRRAAFRYAIQNVIAAGLDAFTRVLDNPAAITGYDTVEQGLAERVRANFESADVMDVLSAATGGYGSGAYLPARTWPSLRNRGARIYDFYAHDPDHVWLEIDATCLTGMPELDGADPQAAADEEKWTAAAIEAAIFLLGELGPTNPPNLAQQRIADVSVEYDPSTPGTKVDASTPYPADGADLEHEYDPDEGELYFMRLIDPELFANLPDVAARTRFLISQTAAALLSTTIDWNPAVHDRLTQFAAQP